MNQITRADIKVYASLQDVAEDINRVRRAFAATVMSYNPPLAQRLQQMMAMEVIRTRGAKPTQVEMVNKPLPTAAIKKVAAASAALDALKRQDNLLTNLLFNLNATKFIEDEVKVNTLKKAAVALQIKVRDQMSKLTDASSKRAQETSSETLKKTAALLAKSLNVILKREGKITYLDGLIEGEHAKVAYVTYSKVPNDQGGFDPMLAYAITEKGNLFYLTPNMVRERSPGDYRLEHTLDPPGNGTPAERARKLVNQMEPLIHDDLITTNHATQVNRKAVPISRHDVSFQTMGEIKTIKFEDDHIRLVLAASVKKREQAEAIAQEALKRVYSAVDHKTANKARDRIVPVIRNPKPPFGFTVDLIFTHHDRMGSRSTKKLHKEEEKFLSQRFNPDEIAAIRRAMNDMHE